MGQVVGCLKFTEVIYRFLYFSVQNSSHVFFSFKVVGGIQLGSEVGMPYDGCWPKDKWTECRMNR